MIKVDVAAQYWHKRSCILVVLWVFHVHAKIIKIPSTLTDNENNNILSISMYLLQSLLSRSWIYVIKIHNNCHKTNRHAEELQQTLTVYWRCTQYWHRRSCIVVVVVVEGYCIIMQYVDPSPIKRTPMTAACSDAKHVRRTLCTLFGCQLFLKQFKLIYIYDVYISKCYWRTNVDLKTVRYWGRTTC